MIMQAQKLDLKKEDSIYDYLIVPVRWCSYVLSEFEEAFFFDLLLKK